MPKTTKPKPSRQEAYRKRGRVVSFILTDEAASEKLDRLNEKHGGNKASIEHALRTARV